MEREKEERRRREELALEFSAEDLALATVPGADFDPTLRHFSKDELRPQPIIRKRKKVSFVIYLMDMSLQYFSSNYELRPILWSFCNILELCGRRPER